jgi:hypothetical protein
MICWFHIRIHSGGWYRGTTSLCNEYLYLIKVSLVVRIKWNHMETESRVIYIFSFSPAKNKTRVGWCVWRKMKLIRFFYCLYSFLNWWTITKYRTLSFTVSVNRINWDKYRILIECPMHSPTSIYPIIICRGLFKSISHHE